MRNGNVNREVVRKKRHNLGEEIRLCVEKMKTKAEYGEWENRASGKSMKWKKYAFRWRQLGVVESRSERDEEAWEGRANKRNLNLTLKR